MPPSTERRALRGEFSLIAGLERELARVMGAGVELGIGDDAAVLRIGRERIVVSCDATTGVCEPR